MSKLESLPESVAALLTDIVSDLDYATGKRRYPRAVSADDAATIAEAFHEQIDRGVETRAELGRKKLMVIACGRGCNTCCEEPIMVTLPEAIVVARWLARPEHREVLEGFRARYAAWHARAAEKLEELSLATSREDSERALALHVETRALCPFNQGGDCTVYPARPILCREAHALFTAANCGPEAAQPARTIPFPQLDEFVVKCKTALWALHHALPGTGRLRLFPLPLAVARLLDEMGV